MKKILLLVLAIAVLIPTITIFADTDSEALQRQIAEYEAKITQLQGQASSLSNQIAQFDAQIKLTELKISQTEDQINLLGGRIDELEVSLSSLSDAFASRAVETYKMSRVGQTLTILLTSANLTAAVSNYHYLQKIEEADRNLMLRLQSTQNIYRDQKDKLEDLQKQLQNQQAQLASEKKAKANLLAVTQNDEKKYQQLLADAKAQLAALSNFASSHGGSSLVPHQDLSDSWGRYYNQRDSNWGNNRIGLSSYAVWEVGCLLTSYSMVSTHFGGSLTPADVAANPSYFSSYSPAYFIIPGPPLNGHSEQNVTNPSIQQLKDALNSGATIIAGLSANGGPYPAHYSDHWVVLRSVDGDSFRINDPWYEGAMNVSLKDHYSGWAIIQARIYR